jgi:hypothetical protein
MQDSIIQFGDAERVHLEELAHIHQATLGYTLNSKLGHEHLVELYCYMQKDKNTHGLIYLSHGKAVGLCLGTTSLKLTQQGLKEFKFKVIRRLFQPALFIENFENIIDQIAISIKSKKITAESNHILLWFMSPENRGIGSGKKLLTGVINVLTEQNCFATVVDVRKNSVDALDGYKKLGFITTDGTKISHILIRK